jgi:Tfp pilus assembly protein PilF
LDDVFAIQDEIAHSTVVALKVRLGPTAALVKRPTGDFRAYELHLMGRHFLNLRTEEGLRKAIKYFEQALQADPNYALAYVGLADSHLLLCDYRYDRCDVVLPTAETAATRALTIDESSGEAHASLAYLRMLQWKWGESERGFERALQLNPGYASAHHWYGNLLATVGRPEQAVSEMQKALELDPLSPIINRSAGWYLACVGDYETAVERLQKTLELNRDDPWARYLLALTYSYQGRQEEAADEYLRFLSNI